MFSASRPSCRAGRSTHARLIGHGRQARTVIAHCMALPGNGDVGAGQPVHARQWHELVDRVAESRTRDRSSEHAAAPGGRRGSNSCRSITMRLHAMQRRLAIGEARRPRRPSMSSLSRSTGSLVEDVAQPAGSAPSVARAVDARRAA